MYLKSSLLTEAEESAARNEKNVVDEPSQPVHVVAATGGGGRNHRFSSSFDDSLVRRGAACKMSRVTLEQRLPDIAVNHSLGALQPSHALSCTCAKAVAQDVDHGRTLSHIMKRYYCTHPLYPIATAGRPMRIVQVGANTGDNANDHLVTFLKSGVAQGVLMEPVPWIYKRLTTTYQDHSATVRLVNAAMSEQDGNVSFMAPNEKSSGWLPQMGGLHLPPKTLKTLTKKGGLRMFDKITVQSFRFETLLAHADWHRSKTPPDVFVVDAEGYDAVIMRMVLDAVSALFGSQARIPIMQFEWKHIGAESRVKLWNDLAALGYCVMQVHYDDVAIHSEVLQQAIGRVESQSCEASYDL
ncbi:methyltransferase, putative [Bodo saltans]|uniref:Methyltransferase, putative n=1 Tax=Bodo saltans TaxID=75058 RepID=A0A0S4JE92_BODSA|nr:methyltransferase, putative [Bodo saltans]|eukprot:CUG87296.1 methyltransferase, putative [Bodo saltans]